MIPVDVPSELSKISPILFNTLYKMTKTGLGVYDAVRLYTDQNFSAKTKSQDGSFYIGGTMAAVNGIALGQPNLVLRQRVPTYPVIEFCPPTTGVAYGNVLGRITFVNYAAVQAKSVATEGSESPGMPLPEVAYVQAGYTNDSYAGTTRAFSHYGDIGGQFDIFVKRSAGAYGYGGGVDTTRIPAFSIRAWDDFGKSYNFTGLFGMISVDHLTIGSVSAPMQPPAVGGDVNYWANQWNVTVGRELSSGTAASPGIALVGWTDAGANPAGSFSTFASRRTVGLARSKVLLNDPLLILSTYPYDGAGQFTSQAGIRFYCSEEYTDGATGGVRMDFYTAVSHTTGVTMRIMGGAASPMVGIGTGATNPTYMLQVGTAAGDATMLLNGYLDILGIANPSAPPAGHVRFHALTTQGITRVEQDNEMTTNVTLARDNVFIARNTSGGPIAHGEAVYVTGSTGGVPNIAKAKADSLTTLPAVGVALDGIADNAFGQVMKLGIHSQHDTSGLGPAGSALYVSAATAGALTITKPIYPNYQQRIGSVLVQGIGNGVLLITAAPHVGGSESGTTADPFIFGGKVGIDCLAPATWLQIGAANAKDPADSKFIINDTAGGVANIYFTEYAGSTGAQLVLRRAAGSAAVPSAVQAGHRLGSIVSRGYGDNAFSSGSTGMLGFYAEEAFTNTTWGTYITLETVDAGTAIRSEKVRVTSAGYVGIGTSGAPSALLHISSASPEFRTTWTNTANLGAHYFYENATIKGGMQQIGSTFATAGRQNNLEFFTTGTGKITFKPGNTGDDKVTFDTSGRVGIGTTGPLVPLHVLGATDVPNDTVQLALQDTTAYATGVGGAISFRGKYNAAAAIAGFSHIKGFKENATDGNYAGAMAFYTRINGGAITERMRITSAGNVGIGATAPDWQTEIMGVGQATAAITDAGVKDAALCIRSNSNAAGAGGAIIFAGNNVAGDYFAAIKGLLYDGTANTRGHLAISTRNANADTALTERIRLQYDGLFGLATAAPACLFSIGGDANGGQWGIHVATELLTVAAAASSDTVANLLPAGCVVLAVTCRVTVVIPTAATFVLTGATSGVAYTGNVSTAAGTTDKGGQHWVTPSSLASTTAQKIRLTPNAVPAANTGRVRITVYYATPTPPTS